MEGYTDIEAARRDYELAKAAQSLREHLAHARELANELGVKLQISMHADATAAALTAPIAAVQLRDGDPCRTDHGPYIAVHRAGSFAPGVTLIVIERREPKEEVAA